MDQVKEYLQIAIKYRFWIVVGIAALLPTIGWFASAGAIDAAEAKQKADIKTAYDGVNKFANNSTPIVPIYKNLVTKKSDLLSQDVNASWRKLYDRQAPLLTWPEEVADTIAVWKRKWPEGTDPRLVTREIIKYKETYLPYVDKVYQSFKPFDYDSGKGIVAAPSKDALLRFPIWTETDMPTLGKVWDTQQRLWVQGTVLDVVAKVNDKAGATNWMTAPIKEVLALEVASPQAQDQKSFAKGEQLQESPDVLSPDEEAAAAEAESAESSSSDIGADMAKMMRGGGSTASMMGGGGLGGGGLGGGDSGPRAPEPFMILESPNPEQAFIVPVYLSVYVQQERIPDLLVEFQNSPMNIEVLDFAYFKPQPHSVTRPEKGEPPASYGGGGGFGRMGGRDTDMRMMMMGDGMSSSSRMYGGSSYSMQMGGSANSSYSTGSQGYGRQGGTGSMFGGGKGQETKVERKQREAINNREAVKQRINEEAEKKDREGEEDEEAEKPEDKSKVADPYYDVVRVEIYGRARFYFPPPEPEATESQADLGTDEVAADGQAPPAEGEAPAAEGDTPAAEAGTPAEGDAPAAEADADAAPPAEGGAMPDAGDAEAKPEGEAEGDAEAPAGETPAADPGASAPGADPDASPGDAEAPKSEPGAPAGSSEAAGKPDAGR